MSLPALGSENEEDILSDGWNADLGDTFAHPLERTLFEIEDDFGIDAAIQRVTICNIIYGNFSVDDLATSNSSKIASFSFE